MDIELLRQKIGNLSRSDRVKLIDQFYRFKEIRLDMLRKAIRDDRRMDILVKEVLGLQATEKHKEAMAYQMSHDHSMTLGFRGFGKTTTFTIPGCIIDLISNPNDTILLIAKSHEFSMNILRDIKRHMLSAKFKELFGSWRGNKWDEAEINIAPRTQFNHVSSLTTGGIDSMTVGKHYNTHRIDDLLDESMSKTEKMREKVRTYYYKELYPTLQPGGRRHISGTVWHHEDIYSHLARHEYADYLFKIPALIEHEVETEDDIIIEYETPWPDKYSIEHWLKVKQEIPIREWNTQYACLIEPTSGDIYDLDWFEDECVYFKDDEIPKDAKRYMGVDLAVSKSDRSCYFVICVVALYNGTFYVEDYFKKKKISFDNQLKKIAEYWDMYEDKNLIRCGIEANGYQAVNCEEVIRQYPRVMAVPINTRVDKVSRAMKRSTLSEQNRVLFKRRHKSFVEALCSLKTNGKDGEWDVFDAFDIAILVASRKMRAQSRSSEPKLILPK